MLNFTRNARTYETCQAELCKFIGIDKNIKRNICSSAKWKLPNKRNPRRGRSKIKIA